MSELSNTKDPPHREVKKMMTQASSFLNVHKNGMGARSLNNSQGSRSSSKPTYPYQSMAVNNYNCSSWKPYNSHPTNYNNSYRYVKSNGCPSSSNYLNTVKKPMYTANKFTLNNTVPNKQFKFVKPSTAVTPHLNNLSSKPAAYCTTAVTILKPLAFVDPRIKSVKNAEVTSSETNIKSVATSHQDNLTTQLIYSHNHEDSQLKTSKYSRKVIEKAPSGSIYPAENWQKDQELSGNKGLVSLRKNDKLKEINTKGFAACHDQPVGTMKGFRNVLLKSNGQELQPDVIKQGVMGQSSHVLVQRLAKKISLSPARNTTAVASSNLNMKHRQVLLSKYALVNKNTPKTKDMIHKKLEVDKLKVSPINSSTNTTEKVCPSHTNPRRKKLIYSRYALVNNSPKVLVSKDPLSKRMETKVTDVFTTPANKARKLKTITPLHLRKKVVNTRLKIINLRGNKVLKVSSAKREQLKTKKFANVCPAVKISKITNAIGNVEPNLKPNVAKANGDLTSNPKGKNTVKRKISFSKYIQSPCKQKKQNGILQSPIFDLDHISPEELVSMDHVSMLKLSAMMAASEKTSEKPLVKKSKFKIVTKHKTKPTVCKQHDAKKMVWRAPEKCKVDEKNFKSKSINTRYKKNNCILVGGIPYRVTKTKMTRSSNSDTKNGKKKVIIIRGLRFEMDNKGNSLRALDKNCTNIPATPIKRIHFGGKVYIKSSSPGVLTSTPHIQKTVSRVVHRSIQRASATARKSLQKNYCLFYNRFGKCNRKANCQYIHDPSKIAVCTRFLKGNCKEEKCPFSHVKMPGKMALCLYFLQGVCTNQDCPYRHEMLEANAELCKPFVQGYCSAGSECKKAHIFICPHHFNGKCTKGHACLYPHPPRIKRKDDTEGKTDVYFNGTRIEYHTLENCHKKKLCVDKLGYSETIMKEEDRYYKCIPAETCAATASRQEKFSPLPEILKF